MCSENFCFPTVLLKNKNANNDEKEKKKKRTEEDSANVWKCFVLAFEALFFFCCVVIIFFFPLQKRLAPSFINVVFFFLHW